MYLYKSSAALDRPFSWGTWSAYNQAMLEADDPRCVEILRKGPSEIDWDDGGARKVICVNLRYRLTGIDKYPVTPVQAKDVLAQNRNIDAFVIDPIVGALILFFPPALLYPIGHHRRSPFCWLNSLLSVANAFGSRSAFDSF